MIVGIDARIPLMTGRGWGRVTCELIEALATTGALDLRILLPRATLAVVLAERVRACPNVRVAFVDFEAPSPDHYWEAAGSTTLEGVLGPVDLVHSPTRFVLPTTIRPLVATVHDIAPLSDPPFKPAYRRATLRALEFLRQQHVRLMTTSEFTRHELEAHAGFDVSDVVVVHPGVSDVFRPNGEHTEPRRGDYVLYVGGTGPNKNLDRFLAAVGLLRETHALDLVIAGDRSWDPDDRRRVLGRTVPSWIHLSGFVTDLELAGYYQQAAVCVVPSLHEGFGLPVLEAMACGTPLACSRIPVFEEVAGNAAAYFNPLVVEEMTTAVRSLVDDRSLRCARASAGRARAQTFTWAETARKTIGVYRRALA